MKRFNNWMDNNPDWAMSLVTFGTALAISYVLLGGLQ